MRNIIQLLMLIGLIGVVSCQQRKEPVKEQPPVETPIEEVKKEEEKKVEVKPPAPAPKKKPKKTPPKSSVTEALKKGRTDPASLTDKEFSMLMLKLVNQLRTEGCMCGNQRYAATYPLKWDPLLQSVASTHSADMATQGVISHSGSDGLKPGERLRNAGYDWIAYTENVASGQHTVEEVISSWIQSPRHCRNLMTEDCTEIGVAVKSRYWTMVMGRPR